MGYFWEAHICQCLNRISSLRRDSPVTIFGNRRKTGKQFVENVIGLAEGLREIGLRRGDVVAIAAINSDLYLEWLLAVTYVGAIAAPLNYRWVGEEKVFIHGRARFNCWMGQRGRKKKRMYSQNCPYWLKCQCTGSACAQSIYKNCPFYKEKNALPYGTVKCMPPAIGSQCALSDCGKATVGCALGDDRT